MIKKADIPRRTYWMSFLWDQLIESTGSEYNPELYLLLSKGKYQLCTDRAVYSYEDRYDNFGLLFSKYWHPSSIGGREVLILGLGMGSVPLLLEKNFPKEEWLFTAVEIDELIIDIAERYTLSSVKGPMDTICADAEMFVYATEQYFDLICVDIFLSDVIPEDFLSQDFLSACKERLTTGGSIIFNTLAYTDDDLRLANNFFHQTFLAVFSDAKAYRCAQNLMLVAYNTKTA